MVTGGGCILHKVAEPFQGDAIPSEKRVMRPSWAEDENPKGNSPGMFQLDHSAKGARNTWCISNTANPHCLNQQ